MRKQLTKGRIVCYMLYFLLVCTLVLGVTYARYTSVVTGTGAAHVAAMEMNTSLDLTDKLQGMAPGEERTISFAVNNAQDGRVSEVAQEYSLAVTTTGNLPLTFVLSPQEIAAGEAYATQQADPAMWAWSGGKLPHTQATAHRYILTVTWPAEKADENYAGEIEWVSLTVEAKQTDPNQL